MTHIVLDIKNCRGCPHFRVGEVTSSDGWDRMEDWLCTVSEPHRLIQGGVEWHEEKYITVPDWCTRLLKNFEKSSK